MFSRIFKRRSPEDAIPDALYGAIVAQARAPALYRDLGVPDTVEGRFEMILLHAALLLRRLKAGDTELQGAGQAVFDVFCQDMDRTLREMGVGDLSVAKKMKGLGEAFYGRSGAYDSALAAGDSLALAAALTRNVFDGDAAKGAPAALAAYMLDADAALAGADAEELSAAHLPFPDPARFLTTETAT